MKINYIYNNEKVCITTNQEGNYWYTTISL